MQSKSAAKHSDRLAVLDSAANAVVPNHIYELRRLAVTALATSWSPTCLLRSSDQQQQQQQQQQQPQQQQRRRGAAPPALNDDDDAASEASRYPFLNPAA